MTLTQYENQYYEEYLEDMELEDEGEYYIPVIHGGDLGRIQAALIHHRGYRTENSFSHPEKVKVSHEGLMFHSEYAGRAHYYAKSAAENRVGIQAILMAFVPRKYLYQNEERDEYSLPTWYYNKMINITILTQEDEEYWNIEEYYWRFYRHPEVIKKMNRSIVID